MRNEIENNAVHVELLGYLPLRSGTVIIADPGHRRQAALTGMPKPVLGPEELEKMLAEKYSMGVSDLMERGNETDLNLMVAMKSAVFCSAAGEEGDFPVCAIVDSGGRLLRIVVLFDVDPFAGDQSN